MLNRDLLSKVLVTFDNKKNNAFLNKYDIKCNASFDTLIASYLLNYNVKEDVSYLSTTYNIEIPYYESIINTVTHRTYRNLKKCEHPYESCDDCKVLTKFSDIYNKFIK